MLRLAAVVAAVLIVSSFAAYSLGTVTQLNADQSQIYALDVQNGNLLLQQGAFARQAQNGTCSGSACATFQSQSLEYSTTVHLAASGYSRLFANQTLEAWGYTPSCLSFCFGGINYYLDPTGTITNDGRDFTSCKQFGTSNTITCTAADFSKYVYLSSSSTAPAATDTYASGPCASANILSTNGAAGGAGTVTIGSIGTTQTDTVALSFSFTGAVTVGSACLLTETTAGTNIIVFGEGNVGPFTFASGDSMTETFSDALS